MKGQAIRLHRSALRCSAKSELICQTIWPPAQRGDALDASRTTFARGHAVGALWTVLELAVAAQVRRIVTFNVRDFGPASRFGIDVVTPKTVLEEVS